MAHEYRYPLTRVCLRGGNMTLPRTMIGLFPDEGAVTVVDTLTGEEHVAHMSGPRVVSGLGPLYSVHGLDVNDELLVSQLDGERFAITAVARADEEAAAEDGEEDPGPEPASGSTEQQAQGASGASTEGSDAAPLAADRSDAQASEPTGGSSSAGCRQERRWVEDREAAAEPAWESGGGPGGDRTSLGEE